MSDPREARGGHEAGHHHEHRHHQGHRHHPHGPDGSGRDRFGNPDDLARYVAKLDDPERDAWQQPDQVLAALGVRPGQVIADLGAGTGYFALRLAAAVGPTGRVFAVDVEERLLSLLRDRTGALPGPCVTPVLALPGDPLLPPGSCDGALIVDAFHHVPDGPDYLRRAARALKPGGWLAGIDFTPGELPVGPPVDHKVSREQFLADARAAGLALSAEHGFLPYQYFVVLRAA